MVRTSSRSNVRGNFTSHFAGKAKKKKGGFRWLWILLALLTGGYFGSDRIKSVWQAGRDSVGQAPATSNAANPVTGPLKIYFTHPEQPPDQPGDIARTLAGFIDQTGKTIDVCAFELDNRVITDALVKAVRRGVRVRLVTETNYLNESGVHALSAVGVPVVDDKRDGALMHNKFMVFDNRAVWTGSMNFTENCTYRNNNHGIFIDDPNIAANYATKFTWMFEQHKFGGAPSKAAHIPNPVVKLADGSQLENYFSTHDGVAGHVAATVAQARKSIHFLAFSFTHDEIARAMLSRAQAGVEVSGVFEKTQTSGGHSEYERLASARLPVYLDGNPRNMHHKAIIIDGEIVIAGSFNFSESADKSNDENLVIIHSHEAARQFEEEFQKVLSVARQSASASVSQR